MEHRSAIENAPREVRLRDRSDQPKKLDLAVGRTLLCVFRRPASHTEILVQYRYLVRPPQLGNPAGDVSTPSARGSPLTDAQRWSARGRTLPVRTSCRALASVGAVAAGRRPPAPPRTRRVSRVNYAKATSATFRGRNARGAARGARLAARAEAITDAPEMDAKAEEVRSRDAPLPNPRPLVIRRTRDAIFSRRSASPALALTASPCFSRKTNQSFLPAATKTG